MTDMSCPSDIRDPAEFVAAMQRRKNATGLTYRELEKKAAASGHALPRSTLTNVLARDTLPRESVVTAFVLACGGDDAEVQEWLATRRRLAAGQPPVTVPPDQVPSSRRRRRLAVYTSALALVGATAVTVALTSSAAEKPSAVPLADGTINAVAIEDTYVTQQDKVGTRGHYTQLHACDAFCSDRPKGGDGERRILLKYRVDGLPTGACVRSANLRMWAKTDTDPTTVFTVHSIGAQAWDEGSTSWMTQPPVGDQLATRPGGPGNQWLNFDVTAAVRTVGVHSFTLHSTAKQGGYFAAKEDTTLNHPAELVVQYTRCVG